MKTAAIIAEYNPFHNGHAYQISELKTRYGVTHVIAVMNGSFMQRGEPAIFDKTLRCANALRCGADLVLELPYVYGAQTAEIFAYGGVGIAVRAGADILSFGCEETDISLFQHAVQLLRRENEDYRSLLKRCLDEGQSYAVSRIKALETLTGENLDFLTLPNNILALEYMRAIERMSASISVIPIQRRHVQYHDRGIVDGFASASYIRSMILSDNTAAAQAALPYPTSFRRDELHRTDDYRYIIKSALLDKQCLKSVSDYENGLENRFSESLPLLNTGVEAFVSAVSTKRYAKSRLRRMLFNLVMNYSADDLAFYRNYLPGYVRILGANEKGREVINRIKEQGKTTAVSNLSKEIKNLTAEDLKIAETERKAYALYHLFDQKYCDDYSLKPVIVK